MNHPPFTLLIHGLHMNGLYMQPLAKKLTQAGFATHAISYRSAIESIDAHSTRIHAYLNRYHDKDTPINLVGHSLGGLVIRHFLATYGTHWQVYRCVTLGTPHQGSICAGYVNRLMPPLVRRAYLGALDGSCPPLTDDMAVEFGVIAGSRPIGLGVPILAYHRKRHRLSDSHALHDGTVYLSETTLPFAKDYLVLPVSHTGLITDETTADEVIHFLRHGKFRQTT